MLLPGSPLLPFHGGEGWQEWVGEADRTARTMIVVPKFSHLAVLFSIPAEQCGQKEVGEEDRTAEDRTARTMIVVPKCSNLATLSCLLAEEKACRRRLQRRTGQ